MSKETGGPAFPMSRVTVLAEDGTPNEYCQTGDLGITMRDYFAAKAMQGWISTYPDDIEVDHAANGAATIARFSYAIADAMLLERSK